MRISCVGSSVVIKYVSIEAKIHRNAALVLESVKILPGDLNHKLFKMYINLF